MWFPRTKQFFEKADFYPSGGLEPAGRSHGLWSPSIPAFLYFRRLVDYLDLEEELEEERRR
jgi:hypothetical protein